VHGRSPVQRAAVVFAVGGALVAWGCAAFVFHASAGHVRTVALRAVLAASVVLLPTALIEVANSGTTTPSATGQVTEFSARTGQIVRAAAETGVLAGNQFTPHPWSPAEHSRHPLVAAVTRPASPGLATAGHH
jgi:hypothetical protein